MKIEEIRIPAPWGHIAAKAWGNPQNETVLLWHGMLDNAGSFDNLIPLLAKDYFYVCVDLPGHGRSTHFDHLLPIYTTDYLLAMKMVFDYFKQKQYIVIAHSYSVQLSILFTLLYPGFISKLVFLDFMGIRPFYPKLFASKVVERHDIVLNAQVNQERKIRSSTYRECVERIIEGRGHGLFKWESAEPLVKRMVEKIDDGDRYVFTFDKRARHFLNPSMTFEYTIDLYRRRGFQCPVLVLLMSEFGMHQAFKSVYKYLKTLKNVKMHIIEGHHDTHNTDPEKIAGYVNKFLMQSLSSKL